MRGPESVPYEDTSDDWQDWDEYGQAQGAHAPILAVACPCCEGLDEAFGTRCCLTAARVMTRELAAFLGSGDVPLHGVSGWANRGLEAADTPGCWRCGDSGVVPCDERTEEPL